MLFFVSLVRCSAIKDLFLLIFKATDVNADVNKSSSEEKPEFLPVFRSGSCAEIGPKQYMEDEHICIDNLVDHLGSNVKFPSPGAFYGVSKSCFRSRFFSCFG